jgi:hypothetical protein
LTLVSAIAPITEQKRHVGDRKVIADIRIRIRPVIAPRIAALVDAHVPIDTRTVGPRVSELSWQLAVAIDRIAAQVGREAWDGLAVVVCLASGITEVSQRVAAHIGRSDRAPRGALGTLRISVTIERIFFVAARGGEDKEDSDKQISSRKQRWRLHGPPIVARSCKWLRRNSKNDAAEPTNIKSMRFLLDGFCGRLASKAETLREDTIRRRSASARAGWPFSSVICGGSR